MAMLKNKNNEPIIYHRKNQYYGTMVFDDDYRYFYVGLFMSTDAEMNKSRLAKEIANITGHGTKEMYNLLSDSSHGNPIEIEGEHIVDLDTKLRGEIEFVAQSDRDEMEDHERKQEEKERKEREAKLKEAEEWVKTLSEKEQEYIEVLKGSMIMIASPVG